MVSLVKTSSLVSSGGDLGGESFDPIAPTALPPDEDSSTWSTSKVVEWLNTMKLGEYGPAFTQHRITGDVLEALGEHHLEQLGMTMIGHRVLLLREIQTLRRKAVNRTRFRTIWEDDAVMYYSGPCVALVQYTCLCKPCCDEPDHYKLTGSSLVLTMPEHRVKFRACCPVDKTTRNIDLTGVAGVSATHTSNACDCGCNADDLHIELNKELGLPPVPRLKVPKNKGTSIAQMIQSAIEENTSMEFGGGPRAPTMARY